MYLDYFACAEFSGDVHLLCLRPEMPFLGGFVQKFKIVSFKMKFDTETNSNMQNSVVKFIFLISIKNTLPFWANLVQKIKVISLSWNLVLRLFWICTNQWWCSFFLFSTGNKLFGQIWPKKSKLSVSAKIHNKTNSNM